MSDNNDYKDYDNEFYNSNNSNDNIKNDSESKDEEPVYEAQEQASQQDNADVQSYEAEGIKEDNAETDNREQTFDQAETNSNYYDQYKGYSSSSQNVTGGSYTTAADNNSGTASYEWNNGEYSGRYTAGGSTAGGETSGSASYSSSGYGYSGQPYSGYNSQQAGGYNGSTTYTGSYSNGYNNSGYNGGAQSGYSGGYGGQSYNPNGTGSYYNHTYVNPAVKSKKAPKAKKEKKAGRVSGVILAICILASGVLGFGGGMLANYMNSSGSGSGGSGMTINKVVTTAEEASSSTGDMSTSDIVKATKNSVVEITTEIVKTGDFLQQYIESGAGSGVIISENGYIITNNHVIEDATSITVTLADGSSYDAKLVGRDSELDVALIKIEATGLDPAEIGDSSAVEIGDKTVVIGNPLGQLGGSVTDGIISAVNRNVMIDGVSHNVIQTNAAINPGNSGGGMFNGKGELIGIIVAKSVDESVEGIGFAIPINDVSDILEDLMQYGYVRGKVSLGMSFVDISNAQTALMYRVSELGCYVSSVEINSNAANAGFQSGDLVTSVNGTSISSSSDIESIISKLSVGDTVEFTVKRNGRTGTLSLVLEEAVPDGIASQNDESHQNGIRDNFGYDPYESTGSAEDFYYYFFN